MTDAIPFVDLKRQRDRLGSRIQKAIDRVLDHGGFIMGPEVAELEARLADYCGVPDALTCASGTDALVLALMALGVGPNDAVIVPTFTFAATAEAVALVGATPVFADVLPTTANIDPKSVEAALDHLPDGVRGRAVIAVDLFGQPADYDTIVPLCEERGVALIADAAQSFGGAWRNRRVGSIGEITTTSFFPAKPLGCYGDGGALFPADSEVAATIRSLRVHGQGTDKYDNVRIGMNGRLDTLQAAILLVKLDVFDEELELRIHVANRYDALLAGLIECPTVVPQARSAWAQYTTQLDDRDAVAVKLRASGIPTAVYYPVPLHRQTAYKGYPVSPTGTAVADTLAERVLSLPMHPYLDEATQLRIVDALSNAIRKR